MSVPRTLSLSGLLVALACSLAACGSSNKDSGSTATTPVSAAGPALQKISPTAGDPPACNFITVADAKKLVPTITKAHGIPTACTYSDQKDNPPTIGFLYLSKGLITSSIAASPNKNQTVASAWAAQVKAAKKLTDYAPVKNLGDSAYGQVDPGTLTVRWLIGDHAYYLHYNYDPKKPSQKKLVTMKDLEKFAKTAVPSDPSKVSTALTSATVTNDTGTTPLK